MNQQVAVKEPNPLVVLNEQLEMRAASFQAALPAHIPVERFKRIILTAVQSNPKLATADRPTLWTSAMKAAQDGLLPDGREAALVIYNTKVKDNKGKEHWVDAVQYLPMIAGIRKKVRNSGEISTWSAHCVHEKDEFDYQLGLDERLHHKPFLGERGNVIAAYSIARLKTGEVTFEVMTVHEINRIRAISKAKDNGPWKEHYTEMCRKTVAKRHSKVLPLSTDLDDLMRRDDDLYDFKGAADGDKQDRPKLSDFANAPVATPAQKVVAVPEPVAETVDAETGEITETAAENQPAEEDPRKLAYDQGERDRDAKKALGSVPDLYRTDEGLAEAWRDGWRERDAELSGKKSQAQ
jgi:recombination protein RecT